MRALTEVKQIYRNNGINALSDSELLSILGISSQCDLKTLFAENYDTLLLKGHSQATAIRINALVEISRRRALIPVASKPQVQSSKSAADIISPLLRDLAHEECWVLFLNRSNKLISRDRLSIGGVSATIVDIKIVMKMALEKLASAIILVHNHPSGNTMPGDNDRTQTKIVKDAAALFDIALLDHIIIAGDNYFSFADDGIL